MTSNGQVFLCDDYREIIRDQIDAHAETRGYQRKLAVAAGCHPSYLSKALKYECELTPDHAFRASQFFQFSHLESDYFMETVNYARAATPELREYCKRRIATLRKESENIGMRFSLPKSTHYHAGYYADWTMTAIHILSSVPTLQTAAAIASRLNLDAEKVQESLDTLVEMELVEKRGRKYVAIGGSLHLDRGSPFLFLHLSNWRLRALAEVQKNKGGVHFSSIVSLSEADLKKLKELVLQFIGTCQMTVASSPEETAMALNIDLFEL